MSRVKAGAGCGSALGLKRPPHERQPMGGSAVALPAGSLVWDVTVM